MADCQQLETDVRACFDALDTDRPQLEHGARLFSRIAYALHGLDALPYLRQQVALRAWTPTQATSAYIKLVAGLLAVVFEAADSAAAMVSIPTGPPTGTACRPRCYSANSVLWAFA